MAGRIYRKKSKGVKILAATLALALLAPLAVSQPAVHAQAATYSVQEQIVMEALDIDSLAGVDYDLVQVEESNQADTTGVSPFSAQPEEDEQNLAVRINKSFPDGTIRSELYVPYTETEEGLENTFALAASYPDSVAKTYPYTYSNFVLTIIGYAGRFVQEPPLDYDTPFFCFKPYYVHASWKNSGAPQDSGVITRMSPTITTNAVKHYYNNATQTMGAALPGNSSQSPEITQETKYADYNNPLSNNYYSSGSLYTPDFGYAFDFEAGFHCFYAACPFTYRLANGTTGSATPKYSFITKFDR